MNQQQQYYREQFTKDLARLIGCSADELPANVPKQLAMQFLHLTSPRTLNDWSSSGKHGIRTVRVGRDVQVMTDWLIDMKVNGVRIPQQSNTEHNASPWL